MSNNLRKLSKELRSYAKRCKDIKYSNALLLAFLLTGMLSIASSTSVTNRSIEQQRQSISSSISDMRATFRQAKRENDKLLKGANLELIQLMEQGDQVVKSEWSSWQFGLNYFYNNWGGTYKGRGDKAEKYPYEGIYQRSNDLFLRNISPDSNVYSKYTALSTDNFAYPATTSDITNRRGHYGLEDAYVWQEPVLQIELGAQVRPKEVVKDPITVNAPIITVNPVTPLSTPAAPTPPTPPNIVIKTFNPTAPSVTPPTLPTPPTFNIKLGSYCNNMTGCGGNGTNGGPYNATYQGLARSYSSTTTINNLVAGSPSLRHSWNATGSVLLKSYFDFTGGGTVTLGQNVTIDSINPVSTDTNLASYNRQSFLLGGSRVATMDNVSTGSKLINNATVNLAGPLVIGFEMQTDTLGAGAREISNTGIITDKVEEEYRGAEGLGGLIVGKTGGQTVASNSVTLPLSALIGSLTNTDIAVSRTPDVVNSAGNIITPGGYTGYKIGLILTYENNDTRSGSHYTLTNAGNINFTGKSSIGIQIFAPGSVSMPVTVSNDSGGLITLGGIESYGLKLSSRVLEAGSTLTNSGTINLTGSNGNNDSLSSGIAILEDSTMTGAASIRAYTSKVTNAGTINVSGGRGNTGMVLKVDAADDITNTATGNINVSGSYNIGMRVDKGTVTTGASGAPQAINNGTITLRGSVAETNNLGMVANGVSIATNNNRITLVGPAKTATGMLATGNGGTVANTTTGNIRGTGLENSIGISVLSGSTGTNAGIINLSGTSVTGVYNDAGTFNMTAGTLNTSGNKAITLYAKGGTSTNITGGTVSAGNGSVGLYADNSTVNILSPAVLEASNGGLLFYNYASPALTNPSGKFNITGNVQANILNGGTAFYFKGAAADTATFLNNMFLNGTSTGKLQIRLNDGASLFVLENPGTTAIKLSSANVSSIGTTLGNIVDISRTTSNKYIAYTVYRGSLEIDKNVNIDNDTDDYYKMNFTASNVTVDPGVTMSGSTANQNIISQGNYDGATSSSSIKVINNGTIDYTGTGSTALAVDFGEITNNATGIIKMAGDNSTGIYGAANSVLTNNGSIELGTGGVGIWGANNLIVPIKWTAADSKNISITNAGKIEGISGKSGVFGIYAVNDTTVYPGAVSTITHSGNIDLSKNIASTGILMTNGTLNSSGNISIKEGSVGVNATDSIVNVTAGTHTIGKESIGFNITGRNSNFNGTGGNVNITDTGSAVFLLDNVNFTSGTNFNDNFGLTSNSGYTYINIKGAVGNPSVLNYGNTKTISNDDTIFISSENSNVTLTSAASITSTNAEVTGVYSKDGSVVNNGALSLTGNKSSALYGENTNITNSNTGNITVGTNGSGMYIKNNTAATFNGNNSGAITLGAGSVGMRGEGEVALVNTATGNISSTGLGALGMSQSGGTRNLENAGTITLTGDKSIGMHSESITTSGHQVKNTGTITLGDSADSANPSVGIYSANGTNSAIINDTGGKIIGGARTVGIYGKNVGLSGIGSGTASELSVGDGAIGIYSDEGIVQIYDGAKISVGKSLGNKQEGVAVYLAGNGQTLISETSDITIGDGSFGFVLTGQGNNATTGYAGNGGNVILDKDSIFIYSADKTGNLRNYNHISSIGDENYGIYASGPVQNYGNINFSAGVGNVGMYSYVKGATTTPGLMKNFGRIDVSASDLSDPDNRKYGIGMAAGFSEEDPIGSGIKVVRGLGNIKNSGTISVTTGNSIGMYGSGTGTVVENNGRIELSGTERNIGMFIEEGATGINNGVITTVGSGNKKQIGIAATSGSTLWNNGSIHIDAEKGYGLLISGAIVRNYGTMNITVGSGATPIKEVEAADMTKTMGDAGLDQIKINAPAGVSNATITLNGVVQTPVLANVQAIPNRMPNDIPTSSVGMYIDTSGINYTRPISNIGALAGLDEADLIIGAEATKYTNSKYIQLSDEMIEPYNDMIRTSGIETWSIYSGSLTWMASITQQPDFTIRNAYLAKVPYTVYASDKDTTRDTYNFADGLEQRYGVDWYGDRGYREKELFDKLNSIGNNERVLLLQAYDEMMGHQYANTQQRINSTGRILDKEFSYLKGEWQTASKESNKMKIFGSRDEYKTDTAGIIDYTSNAYGVAYVNENETIKLGNSTGWYLGAVNNSFKFKDIGKSKEDSTMLKAGVYRTKAFDDNGSLQWTIAGEGFVTRSDMHRKFLVVDEIFNAESTYYTYGAAMKNEISKNFRASERFSIVPYGSLKLEYGRTGNIKEKVGEMRLEVKSNDYFSVKPEVGVEFKYKQPMAVKTNLIASLGIAYENELGKVGDAKNKARVAYTEADWFNIRGEKEDRSGNFKADFKLGIENTRFGVTFNAGYDTKGENIRGGIGLRAIF